jgi:hypothetical protein
MLVQCCRCGSKKLVVSKYTESNYYTESVRNCDKSLYGFDLVCLSCDSLEKYVFVLEENRDLVMKSFEKALKSVAIEEGRVKSIWQ